MPIIFEQDGFKFLIYSNEHLPIHVHVRYGGGEAVFVMTEPVTLRESAGMKVKELSKAEELAESHREEILEKWDEHITRQS